MVDIVPILVVMVDVTKVGSWVRRGEAGDQGPKMRLSRRPSSLEGPGGSGSYLAGVNLAFRIPCTHIS